MVQWMVRLAGHEFDLKALASLYNEPTCRVAKDDDGAYYLTRTTFDAMTDAGEVDKAAREWMAVVNADMMLSNTDYETVSIEGVVRVNGDGSRSHYVLLSGTLSGKARLYGELTVGSPDGQHRTSPEPARAQARLQLIERDKRVREALDYSQRCNLGDVDCYSYAYKISEIILEDMGGGDIAKGVAAVINEGWSSADEMSNFSETVHKREFGGRKARHAGRRTAKAGAKSLSEDEVIACIRRVLRGWLEWKVGQAP